MNAYDAAETAYKNGYEAGKQDAVKARWQPTGKQFAFACIVCKHGSVIASDICRNCLCEKEPGFEFDFIKYLTRQFNNDKQNYTFVGGQSNYGKLFHLEQMLSAKCAQLKETEKDRDRWESAALYYRDLYIKQKQEENKMRETMLMPETVEEFINDYKFTDSKEVYTNGAELIQVLRVNQMLDYYYNHAKSTEGMTFGDALEALKNGERVARKGWNGKDMYVFLAHEADFVTDADISAFDQLEVEVADMLVMKTAQNTFQPGWLASQADMLADDWYIVE